MWGQVHRTCLENLLPRIIPTRVGTRFGFCSAFTRLQDHPHACGDKFHCLVSNPLMLGSSPRVWGQGCIACVYPVTVGIIPTRMGTRSRTISKNITVWDHPHACGDKKHKGGDFLEMSGSSPRVWGQEFSASAGTAWKRIIPTRVGTSYICKSYEST